MTSRMVRFLVIFGAGLMLARAQAASADIMIVPVAASPQPTPIAIPDLAGKGDLELKAGADIAKIVSADLEQSGLFRPIDLKAIARIETSQQVPPHFDKWKAINAQFLLQGNVQHTPDNHLRVEVHLWDIYWASQFLAPISYRTTPQGWRRIGHMIADSVYKRITGNDGYFDTEIAYIAESGPPKKRIKRLAIMDPDGANHRFLTDGEDLVLTPRFSPNLRDIAYLSYFRGTPRVYLYHFDGGRSEVLGDFPGMTFAPRF